MPSRRLIVAAVAAALALCCVVTLHINDESIMSQVVAEDEHAGMMFDHDDTDEDSDDLSPSEQALIDAAEGRTQAPVQPVTTVKPVVVKKLNSAHSNSHPQVVKKLNFAAPVAPKGQTATHLNNNADDLTASEKSLIASAESGFDKGFKGSKQQPRPSVAVKPAKTAKPTKIAKKLKTETTLKKVVVLATSSDDLSADDAGLVAAASRGEKLSTSAPVHPTKAKDVVFSSNLKKAMAKITQSATQLAVASVTPTVKEQKAEVPAKAVLSEAPPTPLPKAETPPAPHNAEADLASVLRKPEALPKAGNNIEVAQSIPHLPLDEARRLVLGFSTGQKVVPHTPVQRTLKSPKATKAAFAAKAGKVTADKTLQQNDATAYATVMGKARHATTTTAPAVTVATKPVSIEKPVQRVPPAADDFAAKLAAADRKAAQMAAEEVRPLTPQQRARARAMRQKLNMDMHHVSMMN